MAYKLRSAVGTSTPAHLLRSADLTERCPGPHMEKRAQHIASAPSDVRTEIEARLESDIESRAAAYKAMSYPALQGMAFWSFVKDFKAWRTGRCTARK